MAPDEISSVSERLNKIEVEMGALKEKVSFFNIIYGKFDVTLGKIQEMIENRRYESNEEIKQVYARIQLTEDKIIREMQNLKEEVQKGHDDQNRRIGEIDRWRWILIGGAALGGWILSNLIKSGSFFGMG